MLDLTSAQADTWHSIFNGVLILGAAMALLGTLGTRWTGKLKEQYSNNRIAAAEVETARANEGTALARKETAILNERAAGLQKESEALRVEYERLKLRVAEERNYRLPRSLRLADKQSLVKRLKRGDLGKVSVVYQTSNPEAKRFSEDVFGILEEAGFEVEPKLIEAKFTTEGQFIYVRSLANISSYVSNIKESFMAYGIVFHYIEREDIGFTDVVIGISSKPTTPFPR